MMRRVSPLSAALILLLASPTLAATREGAAVFTPPAGWTQKADNGTATYVSPDGRASFSIGRSRPYEGALDVKASDVHLDVIKDHKPMNPTASMSANVRLFVNNAESTVELKPQGDKLVGKASAPATGNVRAMTTLADGGKEVGKAQYNLNVK